MCNDACDSERVLVPQCLLLAISASVSLTVGVGRVVRSGVTCLLTCSANRSMARSGRFLQGTMQHLACVCAVLPNAVHSEERGNRTSDPSARAHQEAIRYEIVILFMVSIVRRTDLCHAHRPDSTEIHLASWTRFFCFLWLQCAPPLSCCRVVRSHGRWPAS